MQANRTDTNNEPTKEVRQWNGIPLNITTKTGEPRFSFSPPMSCDYGCIRGTWGAGLDGKALDVYVVSDAPTVFKVVQITPAGAIDEHKYVLGAQNFDEAVETFLKHVPKRLFGAASQYSIAQLQDDIAQQSRVKKDADELTAFVKQLEALIESDDAYGSNVYVLSFNIADDGDITGKFEDTWNRRIFSYSVQKNRIGYKPALKIDRADSATAAKLFDVFSSGYTSLQTRQDAIKNRKKPRCTAVSYSCGKICLSLQNTCWINSAGQKVKKAGGAVASISQGRIDKLRTLAKYLAANGNNKWSKYGRAEYLTAKANNLEATRANLFTKNIKEQASNKLPINISTEPTTKTFKTAGGQKFSVTYSPDGITIEQSAASETKKPLQIPADKARDITKQIEKAIETGYTTNVEYWLDPSNKNKNDYSLIQIRINGEREGNRQGFTPYVNFRIGKDVPMGQPSNIALRTAQQIFKPFLSDSLANPNESNTNTSRQVLQLEDKLKTQKFESLAAFDSKGKQVAFLDGEQYSVEVSEQLIPQLKDTIITHNHPKGLEYPKTDPRHLGNSFSIEDIDLLYTVKAVEMRAVSPGYRHSMKPPKDGWKFKSRNEIVNALINIETGVKKDFQAKVNSGELNYKDAEANHQHEIMTRFSKKYETIYERTTYEKAPK